MYNLYLYELLLTMKTLKVELAYSRSPSFPSLLSLLDSPSANLLNPAFCTDQAQNNWHIFKQCGGWSDI